uniref:Uncharacterized protein n=1 Tax=Megaselia scalaris TaxID=36166 RepID=T1H445_MEGSC
PCHLHKHTETDRCFRCRPLNNPLVLITPALSASVYNFIMYPLTLQYTKPSSIAPARYLKIMFTATVYCTLFRVLYRSIRRSRLVLEKLVSVNPIVPKIIES